VLINLLGPITGAHFNPAVSVVQALRSEMKWLQASAYAITQIVGCCVGTLLAHGMFGLPLLQTISLARSLSDTFAGIRPADVPGFVLAQFAGARLALGLSRLLFGSSERQAENIQPVSGASETVV